MNNQDVTRLANLNLKTGEHGWLLAAVLCAEHAAGSHTLSRFHPQARTPANLQDLVKSIHDNDDASPSVVRHLLQQARPDAGWVDDELEGGALPAGEWWIVDPVEGNVNHVHGLPEWGVIATLARDNEPVVTPVYEPGRASTPLCAGVEQRT